jgi:hypothetical protein
MPKFEYRSVNGLNFIQMYDVFTPDQIEVVWSTFHYLKHHFVGPEGTLSATYEDGKPKKNNKGIFLDDVWPPPQLSDIVSNTIFGGVIKMNEQFPIDSVYRSAPITDWDSKLMQYYINDGDEYDAHTDVSQFTAILFFNEEPKNFEGGDLEFPDYNVKVPFKNNCGIIFPGGARHKVHPVVQINKDTYDGGRLTVSMFTGIGRR